LFVLIAFLTHKAVTFYWFFFFVGFVIFCFGELCGFYFCFLFVDFLWYISNYANFYDDTGNILCLFWIILLVITIHSVVYRSDFEKKKLGSFFVLSVFIFHIGFGFGFSFMLSAPNLMVVFIYFIPIGFLVRLVICLLWYYLMKYFGKNFLFIRTEFY
jgi:hypothetical protein